ncbi:MAG: Holliday junction resolvase Hjc, partial [Methermicoccaceae archaeon]
MVKKKGTRVERELIDLLWSMGYAAVRVAGSGSSSYPSPDILAGRDGRRYAIEVKMRTTLPVYIEEEQVNNLVRFSDVFGAVPCIA